MKFKTLLFSLLSLALLAGGKLQAQQTVLNEGDLAIIALHGATSTKEFAFVTLVDLNEGTEIYFADVPADGDTTLPNAGFNSGKEKYTAPVGGIDAGTVVHWTSSSAPNFTVVDQPITITGNGDKLIAYQGPDPVNVREFLFAVANGASYGTFPAGFTSTVNFGTLDDGEYDTTRVGTKTSLFNLLVDASNWFLTDAGGGVAPLDLTDFTVGYVYDGTSWIPSDPSGTTTDQDFYIQGGDASLVGTTTTSGDVIVESDATLNLGGFVLNVDTLFIESGLNAQGLVSGDVNGTTEFHSYLSSTVPRWFNVAFPVSGTLADVVITNGGFINTLADVSNDTSFVNIYWYDTELMDDSTNEGTWRPVANKSALTDTAGYSIYLGSPFGTLPMTIKSRGSLNAGSVSTPIQTVNGGWNFIGNPYATAIDWNEIHDNNPNLNETYYIFDGDEDSTYVGYNRSAGDPGGSTVQVDRYISAGQAFFVNAGTATQVDFQESQQVLTESHELYNVQPNPGIFLFTETAQNNKDYAYIGFNGSANDTKDPIKDGLKMMNPGNTVPSLYTSLQGEDYMFKFVDNGFATRTVPLSFTMQSNGQVEFSAELRNIDPLWSVTLEDKKTGTFTDIKNSTYSFAHSKSNAPNRFLLHIDQTGSVGLEELEAGSGIYSYMQGGALNVDLSALNADQKVNLDLYDLGGRLLKSEQVSGGNVAHLALKESAKGVYLLKVSQNGQLLQTQKIVNQ